MGQLIPSNIQFFETSAEFREWLEKHSKVSKEVWVGYYKKATGKKSPTWSESVDQALCYGWIDGIRKSLDEFSYANRFTPRSPKSVWSNVNIKKVESLIDQGFMKPEGLKAFELRKAEKSGIYSFELEAVSFQDPYLSIFKKNDKAWNYFTKMSPSYQRIATQWVMSAKQDTTRNKRLRILIEDSEAGIKIAPLRRSNNLERKSAK